MLRVYENGGFELNPADYIVEGLEFVGTCGSFPEQYDVVLNKNGSRFQVGYVRLRYGKFKVYFPDLVYDAEINTPIFECLFDNKFKGSFENETERLAFLNIAASEINKKLNKETK